MHVPVRMAGRVPVVLSHVLPTDGARAAHSNASVRTTESATASPGPVLARYATVFAIPLIKLNQ